MYAAKKRQVWELGSTCIIFLLFASVFAYAYSSCRKKIYQAGFTARRVIELRRSKGIQLQFIIVSQLLYGARDIAKDGEERYRGPRGPNLASLSSFFSFCTDRRHTLTRGLKKSQFQSFQWNLIRNYSSLHKIVN